MAAMESPPGGMLPIREDDIPTAGPRNVEQKVAADRAHGVPTAASRSGRVQVVIWYAPSPMSFFSRKLVCFIPTFLVTLALDQVTKWEIVERFAYGERWVVIPGFFNLTQVRNPGGAFSFLATLSDGWREGFFFATGSLAIVLLLMFLHRLDPEEWVAPIAIGGVLGGAIGNLIDRVIYGEVIDFLDFRLIGGYVWPTFNLADCWIVMGVAVLMIQMFFEADPDEEWSEDGATANPSSADVEGPPPISEPR